MFSDYLADTSLSISNTELSENPIWIFLKLKAASIVMNKGMRASTGKHSLE